MGLLILTWGLLLGCVSEITKNILVLAKESMNLSIARDTLTRWKLSGLLPQERLCRLLAYFKSTFLFSLSAVDSGLITDGQVPLK